MNISGIRTYAEFYDYNTIKNNEAKIHQIQEAKAGENVLSKMDKEEVQEVSSEVSSGEQQQSRQEPDHGAIEYAKQYQPDATYELKGPDSDIMSLDVEKAISDMKKDQVLQQYQFFIGEKKAGEGLTEAHEDENFVL